MHSAATRYGHALQDAGIAHAPTVGDLTPSVLILDPLAPRRPDRERPKALQLNHPIMGVLIRELLRRRQRLESHVLVPPGQNVPRGFLQLDRRHRHRPRPLPAALALLSHLPAPSDRQ